MGKKIKVIVAGAGHGGLTAGALLAEAGHDVTVIERCKEGTLGYDWTDIFVKKAFNYAGIPLPSDDKFLPNHTTVFHSPNKESVIMTNEPTEGSLANMERVDLYDVLLDFAKSKGVKFIYEASVTGPIVKDNRVTGLFMKRNGKFESIHADLIIDAAGLHSPLRENLPASFKIQNKFDKYQIFYTYRAFYERTDKSITDEYFNVYFYHLRQAGLDWYINALDYCDILIGRFEPLTDEQIKAVEDDFLSEYPEMSSKLIRGGQRATIPVRRAIAKMVADGYAAIGDSAAMTIPIIGSGIENSLMAGKMLADAVLAAGGATDIETLWGYQVRYYKEINSKIVMLDKMRELVCGLTPDELDFLFNNGILNSDDMRSATGEGGLELGLSAILDKLKRGITNIPLLLKIVNIISKGKQLSEVARLIPANYNETDVNAWIEAYNSI